LKEMKTMQDSTLLKIIASSLLVGSLSACAQYLSHDEGVSLSAGDAVAHNKAVQMIDPWPRYAERTHIPGSGQRLLVGLKKYNENKTAASEKADTQGDMNLKSEDQ